MNEYKEVIEKKEGLFAKYKKHLKKAIVGGVIAAATLIATPFALFYSSDLMFGICLIGSLALTTHGVVKAVSNGIKARRALKKYKETDENQDQLFAKQKDNIDDLKEKNNVLEEKLSNVKDDFKEIKNDLTKNKEKKEENTIENTKVKVKSKSK